MPRSWSNKYQAMRELRVLFLQQNGLMNKLIPVNYLSAALNNLAGVGCDSKLTVKFDEYIFSQSFIHAEASSVTTLFHFETLCIRAMWSKVINGGLADILVPLLLQTSLFRYHTSTPVLHHEYGKEAENEEIILPWPSVSSIVWTKAVK